MTPRSARSRRQTMVAVAAVLLLGLAACGDDGDGDDTTTADESTTTTAAPAGGPGGYPAGEDDGVDQTDGPLIEAQDFALTSLTVAPGTEVEVSNVGARPHTATADDGAFDSGTVEPGTSSSITAPMEPGDYTFHCEIHPSMAGHLTVQR